MKKYRYSDASKEKREEIYVEELDKRKPRERFRYLAGGLGVLFMFGFIGIAGYIAYPFLERADKYRKGIETQINIEKDFKIKKEDSKSVNYKNDCENWIHGF